MSSPAIAGRVSTVVSLCLIALVVIAYLGNSQPHPQAVPASEKRPAASVLAQPQVVATLPVVLPPPPARNPKALAAPRSEAPRSSEAELNPASAGSARSQKPNAPSPPTTANAGASRLRQPEPKSAAGREPPRQAARDALDSATLSGRPSPVSKMATTEEPGETVVASRSDAADGRTLLRLLEHGSGPTIEFAWPDAAGQREKLFALLGRCFGMRVALVDAKGRLFIASGRANTPWNLNLDRFSGFIREPAGALSRQERRAVERILAHHGGLVDASPVRVLPRQVDARLLGGLRRLIGESYATVQTVRARYRTRGRHLVVERIVADGRVVPGRLELPPVTRGACRRPSRG
jgi:hypothetical protein